MRINRSFKIAFYFYCAFDLFFGGVCGGFIELSPAAAAQFTTVTGTVTDPNGLAYANGTISATLVTSASPTLNGLGYTPPIQPTGLDGSGKFTMQLADTTVLLPSGSKWNFTVCSAGGTIQPSGGKGPVCFSLASPITISGTSQDISTNLNAVAPALSNITGAASGPAGGALTGTYPNPTLANLATGGNPGPVPYVSAAGTLSEDASNFCWDATNHRLGIGTCAPTAALHIASGSISMPNSNQAINFGAGNVGRFLLANPNTPGTFDGYMEIAGQGATHGDLFVGIFHGTATWTNQIANGATIINGQNTALQFGVNSTDFLNILPGGHTTLNTTTDPGANIWWKVNGDVSQTHTISAGTAPTIASGAGTGATITGADESGRITVGTTPGNTIVVNLGSTYTNNPECLADDETQLNIIVKCIGANGSPSTYTLKAVLVTTGAATNFVASDVVKWRSGGH